MSRLQCFPFEIERKGELNKLFGIGKVCVVFKLLPLSLLYITLFNKSKWRKRRSSSSVSVSLVVYMSRGDERESTLPIRM